MISPQDSYPFTTSERKRLALLIEKEKREQMQKREEIKRQNDRRQRQKSRRSGKRLFPEKVISAKNSFSYIHQNPEQNDCVNENMSDDQVLAEFPRKITVEHNIHSPIVPYGYVPIVVNRGPFQFALSEEAKNILRVDIESPDINKWARENRTHPKLIAVVEKLGESANPIGVSLKIRYIQDYFYFCSAYEITGVNGALENVMENQYKKEYIEMKNKFSTVVEKLEMADEKLQLLETQNLYLINLLRTIGIII
jgi:hypothetical protein